MSVVFDQLRISDNGQKMFINIHVNQASYFDDVLINSVTIITADKASETNPDIPTDNFIYKLSFGNKELGEGVKTVDLMIDKGVLDAAFINTDEHGDPIDPTKAYATVPFDAENFSGDLFFVFTDEVNSTTPDVPCRLDEPITLGVTFDENMLYQQVMNFTKQIVDNCGKPSPLFIDFILLWNAFKASVETEHFISAIKFWNMLFGKNGYNSPYGGADNKFLKSCGCHG